MIRKLGFTLAEVLITLGIIGVVAAMTIPTLISDYQEKVTVTKLKKMYSTLSNAYQLYLANGGTPQYMDRTEEGAQKVYSVFAPYLKIAKDCGGDGSGCIASNYVKKNNLECSSYMLEPRYYKVILSDSSAIWFRGGANELDGDDVTYDMDIMYDVNGISGPNRWGEDLFEFLVLGESIYPNGILNKAFNHDCLENNGAGYGCAAWVIQKGNLDYLKCPDDLTWSDNKCK